VEASNFRISIDGIELPSFTTWSLETAEQHLKKTPVINWKNAP